MWPRLKDSGFIRRIWVRLVSATKSRNTQQCIKIQSERREMLGSTYWCCLTFTRPMTRRGTNAWCFHNTQEGDCRQNTLNFSQDTMYPSRERTVMQCVVLELQRVLWVYAPPGGRKRETPTRSVSSYHRGVGRPFRAAGIKREQLQGIKWQVGNHSCLLACSHPSQT